MRDIYSATFHLLKYEAGRCLLMWDLTSIICQTILSQPVLLMLDLHNQLQ